MDLNNKEIVLGVTGGVACYKSLEIIRKITDLGGKVSVIMTAAAQEFVSPVSFQALSGRPVALSMFSLTEESEIGHIKLAERADALLIAPATANIIGKTAHGIADDYLSTVVVACKAPLFLAPAMNHNMWDNPVVQDNLNILTGRKSRVIDPESGFLACGSYGKGRMAGPDKIIGALLDYFKNREAKVGGTEKPLRGVQVIVTAGPTREKIDAVRYLSNYSSGKMGYALAERCRYLGADVTLVSGPVSLSPPSGMEIIKVNSAEQMRQAVMDRSDQARLIIKAAAVGDFRIENPNPEKIKKTDALALKLVKNPDILKELGAKKKSGQYLTGFAAESREVEKYARGKLKDKNLDLIVANDISRSDSGFNVDQNQVLLIDSNSSVTLPLLPKKQVAAKILEHILNSEKWYAIKNQEV